jgi:hypothetical protein
MQNVIKFIVLILLISCDPGPVMVTKHGVKVMINEPGWAVKDMEDREAKFMKDLDQLGYPAELVLTVLPMVQAFIYNKSIPCQNANGCNGTTFLNKVSVRNLGSPAKSAYCHELLHFLQWKLYNVSDPEHKDLVLWKVADDQT